MPGPGGLRFYLEWRITLFTLVLVPLMTGLGFWQLQRAAEKETLAASWEQRQQQPPASLDQLWDATGNVLAYLPVKVSGVFLQDKYFLLDNRIFGGRFGYEVLGIMRLDGGRQMALVNRGWVAGDASRVSLPAVPQVSGPLELTGHIYVAPGKPYLLAEQRLGDGWPKILQAVEMDKITPSLAALGDGPVFPYSIRIAPGQPAALAVDWQIINISPQKHRAYAAQWFTMALVLTVFYLLRNSNLWQLIRPGAARDRG